MAERIAQLAALVDRSWTFRRSVAGNPTRKRKLRKELLEAGLILADIGIDLAVGAFEVGIGNHRRAAVAWAGDVNHVEVVFLDDPVQVHVDEVLPRRRAPMSQQHALHIGERQRPLQQRIVVQINLADRQIVGGAPIRVHLAQQFRRECAGCHGLRLPLELRLRTRVTDLAIMSSSSVRMTRTLTRPSSGEMSGALVALRFRCSSTPRKPRSWQIRSRMSGACSPMPPAKTSVSNPPSAAAKEPIHFFA